VQNFRKIADPIKNFQNSEPSTVRMHQSLRNSVDPSMTDKEHMSYKMAKINEMYMPD
jgi:hypothetical protein